MFQSGGHGNWITMGMGYEADVYCNLTKDLSMFYSSCHENYVTNELAMRNAADAFIPKNFHSKYKLNTT